MLRWPRWPRCHPEVALSLRALRVTQSQGQVLNIPGVPSSTVPVPGRLVPSLSATGSGDAPAATGLFRTWPWCCCCTVSPALDVELSGTQGISAGSAGATPGHPLGPSWPLLPHQHLPGAGARLRHWWRSRRVVEPLGNRELVPTRKSSGGGGESAASAESVTMPEPILAGAASG